MNRSDTLPGTTPPPPLVNRRRLLGTGLAAAAAFICWKSLNMLTLFLRPVRSPDTFGATFDLGPLSQLPSPADPPLGHDRGRFWLVHTDTGLSALYKSCTHLDCRFSWNVEEQVFICPCHGSRFSKDGTVLNGPAPRSLDRFPLSLTGVDGAVIAATDPGSGAPLPLPRSEAPPAEAQASGDAAEPRLLVDTGHRIKGAPLSPSSA